MRRLFVMLAAVIAWGLLVEAACAARRPNIVILLADDLGYADVGFHGCREIPTPNLDALAAAGVRCTSGYVSCPYCSPTRAGLLTGRYQQRFGHEFNPGPGGEPGGARIDEIGLPLTERTFGNRLKAAGYATGIVGKWHLGVGEKFRPLNRGFDEYFGFLGGAHVYQPNLSNIVFPGLQANPGARPPAPIYRGRDPINEPEYLTDAFAREAVSFIERHQQNPFLLYLAFNAVHTPMNATDARERQFASIADPMRRTYCAMTLALDEAIGKVLEKLRTPNLEDDTLIFFCSDNGGPTVPRAAKNWSNNAPLRGSKVSTLEGGVRVPFVVSWKGHLPAGKVYDAPVIQLDFLPTALAAAGVNVVADDKLDGVNLLPYLGGETSVTAAAPHEALYWRLGDQFAIRKKDWKLVKYSREFAAEEPASGLSPVRLYDLNRDIGETNDLAASHPEIVEQLQSQWDRWSQSMATPLWQQQSSAPAQNNAK